MDSRTVGQGYPPPDEAVAPGSTARLAAHEAAQADGATSGSKEAPPELRVAGKVPHELMAGRGFLAGFDDEAAAIGRKVDAHVAQTTGERQAPVRKARTVSIAISGSSKTEEWLTGKLLEHSVRLAEQGVCYEQAINATITLGDRTATVTVTL